MKKITSLQLFSQYLSRSENWAFRLIDNLPSTQIIIGSEIYLENKDFYSKKFSYLKLPIKQIRWHETNIFTKIIYKFISFLLKLSWYIQLLGKNVDIIHCHYSVVGWEYRKLAKRLKVPLVVSFYGYDYESLPFNKPKWKKRYSRLFKEVDLFICEGPFGAKTIESMGCPAQKIQIVKLGVNIDAVPFIQRKKNKNELNLLQIANLTEKKGHYYTIKAFIEALYNCPNMQLTIVGPDVYGLKKGLLELIKGTPAADKVQFIDSVDFSLLYEYMKDFHVFIHPSCYSANHDCEGGAPVVLLDAQATGMPVISTDHCDIPSEVIDGETGLLTPEKDYQALAKSIKFFYDMDDEKYQAFIQNCRKHIEKKYDMKKNAIKLEDIYQQLIDVNIS